jgi:hypothetical protein
MDIASMHEEFKLLMDKADGGSSPSFLTSEINRFLNAAIEKFVAKRAFGNNPRRTGFEEDQKRRDDLRNIVNNETLYTAIHISTMNKLNGVFVPLPDNYRHAINEEALVTTPGSSESRRVSVTPITHDRYNKIIDDPFNKPEKDTVYRLDYNDDRVELICGEGQVIDQYYLRYLKNPAIVDKTTGVNCDLAKHTHREIVRMAVLEALENTENPRYQSSKIELNEIE